MKLGRPLYIIVWVCLCLGEIQAQLSVLLEHNRCGSHYALSQEWGRVEGFEAWMEKKMPTTRQNLQYKDGDSILYIPVVFHIIHYGESPGQGTNLAQAQIAAQLEQVNHDLRRREGTSGYNTHPFGADMEIELRPALFDVDGNRLPEPGIHRIYNQEVSLPNSSFSEAYVNYVIKPATQWPPTEYLNVWVLNLASGIMGFAQFPEASGLEGLSPEGEAERDGVVLHYQIVGSTDYPNPLAYNTMYEKHRLGRVLTHELGHWLGLRHTWGDGGCASDDYCEDTPYSEGPNYGCPDEPFSCGSYDMVENYMDYTSDACVNTFTQEQKWRAHTVLANSPRRAELRASTKATPPANIGLLDYGVVLDSWAARITWDTDFEINTSHFKIMKSLDGENFSFLTKVGAMGGDGIPYGYEYVDRDLENGYNYYKLMQVGDDGQQFQLGVKSINYYVGLIMDAFPNPFEDKIDVTIRAEKAGAAEICLYDMSGRMVARQAIQLNVGNNLVEQDVSQLGQGLYMLKVVQNRWVRFLKIQKI